MNNLKIGIIGKVPPPFGGVTVHVSRLYDYVNSSNLNYKAFLISSFKDLKKFLKSDIIHLHQNNPYMRFCLIIISKLFLKKCICTLHRDHDRDKGLKKTLTIVSLFFTDKWIVLNNRSFEFFKKFNNNVILSTSFIPPSMEIVNSEQEIINQIKKIKKSYKLVICTCAHHYRVHEGKDIYGIFEIFELAKKFNNYLFVFSDPSSEYSNLLNSTPPPNFFIINFQHHFVPVLRQSNVYLRHTNTDGDSVTVREALYFNKICLSTNVVDRPEGVFTYNYENLFETLKRLPQIKPNSLEDKLCLKEIYEN